MWFQFSPWSEKNSQGQGKDSQFLNKSEKLFHVVKVIEKVRESVSEVKFLAHKIQVKTEKRLK